IRERAIAREVIQVAQDIADTGFNPDGRNATELLDYAESKVFQIAESHATKAEGPIAMHAVLEKTVDRIEQLYQNPHNGITGLSSGYHDLDKMTAGFQKADLVIVAARPSMGKTTFAMNLCENAMMEADKPVLIFSLEMPAEQIMMRMLASMGRINQTNIRTGQLGEDDWARLSATMARVLDPGKMYIDDSSGLTPTELRSRARRVARDAGGLSMIMVDYLQLMRVPGYADNRTQEIAEISRSLKALAKELNIPIVALSQLNRSLEQRADKRPINSDLRESGSIEQDADLIMFIYRDEVYNEDSPDKGIAEIIIGKQRNGPIGRAKLTFMGQYSRFDNYAAPMFEQETIN
ncbi:MAG: replicative DNA helicase, partial [Shewanellaceae bacterium]|nr:replicative DNA helicase [Shewanellaceae bacterium]